MHRHKIQMFRDSVQWQASNGVGFCVKLQPSVMQNWCSRVIEEKKFQLIPSRLAAKRECVIWYGVFYDISYSKLEYLEGLINVRFRALSRCWWPWGSGRGGGSSSGGGS